MNLCAIRACVRDKLPIQLYILVVTLFSSLSYINEYLYIDTHIIYYIKGRGVWGETIANRVICCIQMIVTAQHCTSLDPFYDRPVASESQIGTFYTVRINWPDDSPDEWTCTCKSFAYRGQCKHIDALAQYKLCHWHELVGPEEQTEQQEENHICPRCGNMTSEDLEDDGKKD